ncbi:Receptor-like protein kinase HSL1 [Acorus calamus]|uniref:non-specific serine/threonine protein kinase n=1 Tax=Acorus calamus TaxID=4465 RepID=A0AAV9CQM2_ACOCL|nr:Receptor-like protein kinase HSL1 [Acorus calamus]
MAAPNEVTNFISVLLLFTSLPTHSSSQQQPDHHTVLDIRDFWGAPLSTLWNSSLHYCSWSGIQCNPSFSVITLSLSNLNITSPSVPPSICRLPHLSSLDLSLNNLGGPFPTTLYNCTNLGALDLSQNLFVGAIPHDADRLSPNLTLLHLSSNNFSGGVPASLARLTSLVSLTLNDNLLDGPVADLGNLTNLETLSIADNPFPPHPFPNWVGRLLSLKNLCLSSANLTGPIPASLGNLTNLEMLTLANNPFPPHPFPDWVGRLLSLKDLRLRSTNLHGPIPASLGGLSALETFDAAKNGLTGPIPGPVWRMGSLKYLYLFENRFSGVIDGSVQLPNLTEIDLSKNDFSGPIPPAFGRFRYLELIFMSNNRLSGRIPDGIGRLTLLRNIRLFNNNLSGPLPPDLGRYSKLQNIELSNNTLSGEIPKNLCFGRKLGAIVLFNNRMSGPLPESLAACETLTAIMIYDNGFSGPVPRGIWSLPALDTVMISRNSFSGALPDAMPAALTRLNIDNNDFSGPLPASLGTSSRGLHVLIASHNRFSGAIPLGLASLAQLQKLALDGNRLSGAIPDQLGGLTSLTFLNLSDNGLSGQIPASIGSLPVLTDLDLSKNELFGEIPPQITNLKLTFLNLSSNSLSGSVPITLQNSAYERSFLSNPGLCGGPIISLPSCRAGSGSGDSKKGFSSPLIITLLALAGAVGAGASVFVVFALREFHRRRGSGSSISWKLTSFYSLDFTGASIVSGLTEENLVACGGAGKVYRVPLLNRPDQVVAVKKLCSNRDAYVEKEFQSEIDVLGRIRHANIVKLLCCISSDNVRLLVYEYMENGGLDRWIHGGTDDRLDWPTRLRVAVDAAQGLSYMHHDYVPPVVHRDFKSSNVLLDADFMARIADFGLARMLARPGEPGTVTAGFAGSFGYMAPECAYSNKVNEKMDVYSFGVVVLELVTGREANDGGGDGKGCLAEWAWRHVWQGRSIREAIDGTIRAACVEEMCMVFKVGLACTKTLPSARPSMKDVEQILLRLRREGIAWASKILGGENFSPSEYDGAPLLHRGRRGSWRKKVRSEGGGDDGDTSFCIG